MIRFPVFERLEVKNYGLYPGTTSKPGLQVDFRPGLTLVLGANGLGKTTLITILYRCLSGGWDLLRGTLESAELGGASLEVKRLDSSDRALFADRVQDLAVRAEAMLTLTIGEHRVQIRRRLENLGLMSLQIDDDEPITDEEVYRTELSRLSGAPSFGDWLLLLRHLVFYFEDRRSLVWDASAQSQILRVIFLESADAYAWYQREREILKLDSNVRNLTYAINRLRKRVAADEKASGNEAALRSQLKSLVKLQEKDEADREAILTEHDDLDFRRHKLRRDLLEAELHADASARALEVEKLSLLQRYFPDNKKTASYLYSLLIAQGHCAICDTAVPNLAADLSERIANLTCVVCGSDLDQPLVNDQITSPDAGKVESLRQEYESNQGRVSALEKALEGISRRYEDIVRRLADLRVTIEDRTREMRKIENALPRSTAGKAKEELDVTASKIAEDKATLAELGEAFKQLVGEANTRILQHSGKIKQTFAGFADDFLFEKSVLKWSPDPRSVGQLGLAKVTFPAFELDMSGTDFTGPTRRSGPDAVSESQREFIDLAFRMALMHVAAGGTGGSLVLDAPESSLDAVFVKRAADVLCRFGRADAENRLIVASNLIDGDLLPELIRDGIKPGEEEARLVNLMKIAVPTAALRENAQAYRDELENVLKAGGLR